MTMSPSEVVSRTRGLAISSSFGREGLEQGRGALQQGRGARAEIRSQRSVRRGGAVFPSPLAPRPCLSAGPLDGLDDDILGGHVLEVADGLGADGIALVHHARVVDYLADDVVAGAGVAAV